MGQLDGSGHEIEQIAYYSAINGYTEVAIGELTNLKNRLMYGSYIKWLITYLICNGLLILYCFLVLVFGSNVAIGEISYCLVSSTVGSFLTYTKKENDKASEHYLPIMDALITFFASCISGFIVYCILKSNLVFGAFNESKYGMMLVCFIAGYNEDIPLKLLRSATDMIQNMKRKGST